MARQPRRKPHPIARTSDGQRQPRNVGGKSQSADPDAASRSAPVSRGSPGPRQASPGAKKTRHEEQGDLDLSWLSVAERAVLRRELNRRRASSGSSAASESSAFEASCGLIVSARAARTSREDEVRYRVDPNIWDLPQFASMPYDQLVSEYLAWLSARTERGGPASADTIWSARDTLGSFRKGLVAEGEPLVASSISAKN